MRKLLCLLLFFLLYACSNAIIGNSPVATWEYDQKEKVYTIVLKANRSLMVHSLFSSNSYREEYRIRVKKLTGEIDASDLLITRHKSYNSFREEKIRRVEEKISFLDNGLTIDLKVTRPHSFPDPDEIKASNFNGKYTLMGSGD